MNRFHAAGAFAALTTLFGILSSPEVLGILPAKVATGVMVGGVVLQAMTKGVQHGNTVVVPRDDAVAVGLAKPKPEK